MKKELLPSVIAGHAVSTVGMAFMVIGSFACCRFCTDKAWAFSYPTRASTSQGSQSLNENLFRRYHQEITALKAPLVSSQKNALSTESQRALSLAIHLKNQEELENLSRDTPLASVDRNRRVTSITREQAQEVLDSYAGA